MTKPFKYQKEGRTAIRRFGGRCILADEMGLGKTFQALAYASKDVKRKGSPIIAVVPAYLKYNWENEAKKHFNLTTVILDGRIPNPSINLNVDLIIINYSILDGWVKLLRKKKPKIILLDEAHYLITFDTIRTLAVYRLAKGVRHIIAMTGTPMTDCPINLWPVCNLLRPDIFKNYRRFVKAFCDPKRTWYGWNLKGSTKKKKLAKILRSEVMIRRMVIDVLKDLPSKKTEIVLLDIKKRGEYKKAEANFMAWLSKKDMGAAHRASKAESLVKPGHLRRLIAELKTEAVIKWIKTLLRERNGKALIFGIHVDYLTTLQAEFKNESFLITGNTPKEERRDVQEQFKTDSSRRLLFGNMEAMGSGLNLVEARYVAIAELPWLPHLIKQAIARAWRIGQKKKVRASFLIAHGTIEERMCDILQRKQRVVDAILNGDDNVEDFDIYDELQKEVNNGCR